MGLVSAGTLLIAVLTVPASGQVTSRVSVDSSGAEANGSSGDYYGALSMSADGRFVAFMSWADNLVPGDTNHAEDVFVHDCRSGETERVSIDSGGVEGNGDSSYPSISRDGRYVAFDSSATNLVSGDTNGEYDIFVRDRQSGTTERVSVATSGAEANDGCVYPSISADGRHVAFHSRAWNLVGGDGNGTYDIFVHDCQNSTTELVSVNSSGVEGNQQSKYPSISGDGRYVAFESYASNLVVGDTNANSDIFVHDRLSGATEIVSVATSGEQGHSPNYDASISADGQYVAFVSSSDSFLRGDWNADPDIFVRDRQGGTTDCVSVATSGAQGNGESEHPSISADGRYVAFDSQVKVLVGGDTNGWVDVFVHDRVGGTSERVSISSSGAEGNDHSIYPSISADGGQVVFESDAMNLVGGDTNGWRDIFLRDRGIGMTYCTASANSTGAPADLSASGSASSGAGDLMLTSMPVPNQNGIFFHGSNPSQVPFGNGFLCTTGGIVRGSVVMTVGNIATYTYDNSDAKHSLAAFVGITRNFQHWFRDPAGGGAFFNTSNAMSIAVLP